ncbi:MAG: (d)CMP kinase [Kiritimatiellae bacterium]|nr:(d)CMP kinase [Kiritimatiellia bacterium]
MPNNKRSVIVAIDGPSASGKSTVSKRVAEDLKFVFVGSGAFYRGMTWKSVREGVEVKNPEQVIHLMFQLKWNFYAENRVVVFTIDGEDPGLQLRSEPVREKVATIATIPEVRSFLVERLRETKRFGDMVMEGRDVGSVIFPDTPLKFYLDADPQERARRRHKELVQMEGEGNVSEVLDSLTRRDQIDRTRKIDPLQISLGAKVINTTSLGIEEVVSLIVSNVQQAISKGL